MLALIPHPENRGAAVRTIEVDVERADPLVRVRYVVTAAMERLLIPPPRPARFSDGLWRHTCCELFVARRGSAEYLEFNFSPSGEWALYGFSGYRTGGPLAQPVPVTRTQLGDDALRLEADVRCPPGPLTLALSAVMEERDGALSYWALRHAPGKPDFHHRDAFALELA
jgi:hypothetical protein